MDGKADCQEEINGEGDGHYEEQINGEKDVQFEKGHNQDNIYLSSCNEYEHNVLSEHDLVDVSINGDEVEDELWQDNVEVDIGTGLSIGMSSYMIEVCLTLNGNMKEFCVSCQPLDLVISLNNKFFSSDIQNIRYGVLVKLPL